MRILGYQHLTGEISAFRTTHYCLNFAQVSPPVRGTYKTNESGGLQAMVFLMNIRAAAEAAIYVTTLSVLQTAVPF